MVRIWGATLLALTATAGTVWAAAAQTSRSWDGSTSTSFNDGTNWSGDDVPNTGSELANINNTTNNPVIYDTTGITVGAVRVSEDTSACTLDLGANSLTVDNTTGDGEFGVGVGSLAGGTRYGTMRINTGTLTVVDGGMELKGVDAANQAQFIYDGAGTVDIQASGLTLTSNATFTMAASSVLRVDGGLTISAGCTFNGASGAIIYIESGDFSNSGTFNANGCTVIFDGTANQKIAGTTATTFANLTISNTGTSVVDVDTNHTVSTALTIDADGEHDMDALTLTLGGTFTNNGTFTSTGNTSTVVYNGTGAQTVTNVTCYNLTISNAGTAVATLGTGAFTVSNTLTISADGELTANAAQTFNVGLNWSNSGTFNQSTSLVRMNGTVAQKILGSTATTFYDLTIVNTGTTVADTDTNLTVTNAFTIEASRQFDLDNLTLTLTGTFTATGTWVSASNLSTVVYNGTAAQTATLVTYYNLTISNTGAAVATFAAGSPNIDNTLTISADGELTMNGAQTANVAGNFTNNGTFNAATSTVIMDTGGTATIGGSTTTTFYNLTINDTSAAALVNTAASLTVTNAFLLNDSADDFTLNDTLTLNGTATSNGDFTGAAGSTVIFNGAAQTLLGNAAIYNHLTLQGGGTKTQNGTMTVNGNLTVQGSCTITLNAAANVAGNATVTGTATLNLGGQILTLTTTDSTFTLSGGTLQSSSAASEIRAETAERLRVTWSSGTVNCNGLKLTRLDYSDGGLRVTGTMTWTQIQSVTLTVTTGGASGNTDAWITVTVAQTATFASFTFSGIVAGQTSALDDTPSGSGVIRFPSYSPASAPDAATLENEGANASFRFDWGTAYTGASDAANDVRVSLADDGVWVADGLVSGGTWTINYNAAGTGSVLHIYYDDDAASPRGILITKSTGSDMSGLDMVSSRVRIGHVGGSLSLTHPNIGLLDTDSGTNRVGGTGDSDIPITVANANDNITFTADTGAGIYVTSGATLTTASDTITDTAATGNTFDIEGTWTISTGSLTTAKAFDATGGTITFSGAGSMTLRGAVTSLGTFTASTSTVTYDSATSQNVVAATYNNLTINTAATIQAGVTVDVNVTLTVNAAKSLTLQSTAGSQATLRLASTGVANIPGTFAASGTITRTTAAVAAGAATIPVSSTTGFSAGGGTAYIRSDDFTYTGISGNDLTGVSGVTIAHLDNVPIGHRPTVTSISGSGFDWNMTGSVNVTALAFGNANVDGFYADLAAAANFVSVQGIACFSGGTTHMRLRSSGAGEISCYDVSFDSTGTNNVRMTTPNGATTFRARFVEAYDTAASPGEARDTDADNGETGAGYADWVYRETQSITGTMEGEPAFAYDFNTGGFTSLYVNARNVGGAGTADRIYALNATGLVKYSYDIPNANGDIVGSAWWWTEGASNMVYVMTTLGYLYKWADTGSALTIQANYPFRPVIEINTDPALGTPITVGLCQPLADGTNIFVSGTQGGTDRVMKVQISNRQTLWISSATITTGLDAWGDSGTTYIYGAGSAFLRVDHTGEAVASIAGGGITAPPFSFWSSTCVLVGDSAGSIHAGKAINTTWEQLSGSYPFATSGAVTSRINSEWLQNRVYWGTGSGTVHGLEADSTPAELTWSPVTVGGGTAIDSSPVVDSGLIYIGNNGGRIFVINNSNGTVTRTDVVASSSVAVGDIFWDWSNNKYGAVLSDGRVVFVNP